MGISPRTLGPGGKFTPKSIKGLALWLDGADTASMYPTELGPLPSNFSVGDAGDVSIDGWWSADNPANVVANGRVVLLSDMAGSGFYGSMLQPITFSQDGIPYTTAPQFIPAAINGYPAMRFASHPVVVEAGGFLFGSADNAPTPQTIIAVYKSNSEPYTFTQNRIASFADYDDNTFDFCYNAASQSGIVYTSYSDGGTLRSPTPESRGWQIFSCVNNIAGSELINYRNGVAGATAAHVATSSDISSISVGGSNYLPDRSDFDLAELMVWSAPLTTTQRRRVEQYLSIKYGIQTPDSPVSTFIAPVTAPTDIVGCVGWWDCSRTDKMFNATTGGSLVADGGAVLRLEDLSGNGKHLIQATSGSAPLRQDGARNGLPALNFAGTKSLVAGAAGDWNFLHNTQGGTVIAVIKPFDTADPQTFAYGVATNVGGASTGIGWNSFFDDRYPGYFRNNHVSHYVSAGVAGQSSLNQERNDAVPAANDFSLLSFTPFAGSPTTAGRGAMYVSGTSVGNVNSSTLAPSASNSSHPLTVGVVGGNSIAGLAELIVYNTVLSAVDRARVEKYLQQKWATPTVPDPTPPPIGAWADRSGNNRHAVQATAGNRPTIGASSTAGKTAMRNNGNGSVALQVAAWPYTAGNTQFAVFNGAAINQAIYQRGSLNDEPRMAIQGGTLAALMATRGGSSAAQTSSVVGYPLSQWAIGATLFNTSLGRAYRDGVYGADATDSQTFSGDQDLRLLSLTTNIYGINGGIAEFIYYDRQLTASEVTRVARYLSRRWGIALAPQVSNLDAQDWINRVYQQGGSVSPATAIAVNQFCQSINDAGIRDRFLRLNLFAGSFQGAFVPLFRGIATGSGGNILTKNTANDGGLFSSAAWLALAGATKGAQVAAPDGTLSATSVTLAGGPTYAAIRMLTISGDWVANATGTFSVWARKPAVGGATAIRLGTNNTAAWNTGVAQKFTLTTEWQRFAVSGTIGIVNALYALIGTMDAASGGAHDADCNGIVELWRPQIEVGTTATAWQACQYGNTTDTNLGSPAFLVGDYSESSGLQGNGSNKYLNTGVPMNFTNLRDYHLSSYVSSITSGNAGLIGADTLGDGVSPRFYQALVSFSSATRIWVWYNYGNTGNQSDNSSNSYAPGLLTGVGSPTANNLYAGASSVASSAVQADQTGDRTLPVFVFAYNLNGSASNYANARLGGYSLGRTMTATQVGQYNAALAAFNTAMGRA
jgi:hypothetical protein